MKTIAIAILLLQAASGVPGAAPKPAGPAPLAPSGKWTVDYAESACTLSRDYGVAPARTTVGFNPSPFGNNVEVLVLSSGTSLSPYRKVKGKLVLEPTGRAVDTTVEVFSLRAKGVTILSLTAEAAIVSDLRASSAIAIEAAGRPRLSFAVPDIARGFGALRTCQDDLLKGWGVSEEERALIAIPEPYPATPANPAAMWITNDDYPGDALAANKQGTSVLLWTIGIDGRIHDCKVVSSSKVPSLDRAGCTALAMRARYSPARNAEGKPIISHGLRRIIWRLNS